MEILYLSDVSQLDYVLRTDPLLLKQLKPLTGDMVVAFELEKMGLDFIDEWDYIRPEELKSNLDLAHSLSITWWHDEGARPNDVGLSLCEAAQQDMVYPFIACLNARTVYERLFSEFRVDKIDGYFLPNTPVIRTGPAPTSRAVGSLTQAVLLYMAEKRQIQINKLVSKHPLTQAKMAVSNSKMKALRTLWSSNSTKQRNNENSNETNNKVVLIYEALMPASEYASLIRALGRLPNVKAITISMQVLHQGEFNHDLRSDLEKSLEQSWKEIDAIFNTYKGEFPEIFANRNLTFQFDRNKKEMASAARYGSVFDAFLEKLNPSLVIFAHEAFTVERVLVKMAKNRNIPTASLSHAGVRHKLGYRGSVGDADIITVWNEADVSALTSFGVDKSRIYKVGSIRYEDDYTRYAKISHLELNKKRIKAKMSLGMKKEKPLITLMTAAVNTGFAFALAEPHKHRDSIREFISLAESRQDLQFIIKAHPSFDYYELYRRLIDPKKCPNLLFLENTTLERILEASDVCLMINYCSTAALEAMLHKVPVAYVNNAVYPLDEWQDNLNAAGVHRIHSISEFHEILNVILNDSKAGKYSFENAQRQVADLLDIENFQSICRTSALIGKLLEIKKISSEISFLNAKTMKVSLFKNQVEAVEYFKNSSFRGDAESMMLVYSYLAGYNNLGPDAINAVSEILDEVVGDKEFKNCSDAQRGLIASYISGRLQNWGVAQSSFRDLKLILHYFIWPQKFVKLSKSERLNLVKYAVQTFRELFICKVVC
jgi:hypothetical protein